MIEDLVERWHRHLRGDLPGGLDELLADDVVFHSPVVFTPQRGKDITTRYLQAAAVVLNGEAFHYTRQVLSGDTAVLEFETDLDGTWVDGVDIIRADEAGRIVEFRVMIRPLRAIQAVHARMGAMLAGPGAPPRREPVRTVAGGGCDSARVQRVDVTQDLAVPVERAYAFLSEHENLGPLLGARVRRLRDGDGSRNGQGSVREFRIGPLPAFEETVTAAEPPRSIDYRITRGSPLRAHRGRLEFTPQGTGSRVRWTIVFSAPPVLDVLVRAGLTWRLRKGLASVDARA